MVDTEHLGTMSQDKMADTGCLHPKVSSDIICWGTSPKVLFWSGALIRTFAWAFTILPMCLPACGLCAALCVCASAHLCA